MFSVPSAILHSFSTSPDTSTVRPYPRRESPGRTRSPANDTGVSRVIVPSISTTSDAVGILPSIQVLASDQFPHHAIEWIVGVRAYIGVTENICAEKLTAKKAKDKKIDRDDFQ